jgi:hypothetical protein
MLAAFGRLRICTICRGCMNDSRTCPFIQTPPRPSETSSSRNISSSSPSERSLVNDHFGPHIVQNIAITLVVSNETSFFHVWIYVRMLQVPLDLFLSVESPHFLELQLAEFARENRRISPVEVSSLNACQLHNVDTTVFGDKACFREESEPHRNGRSVCEDDPEAY